MHLEWYNWIALVVLVIFLPRDVRSAYRCSVRGDGFWPVLFALIWLCFLTYLVGHGTGSW